jgi:hypothetical protein
MRLIFLLLGCVLNCYAVSQTTKISCKLEINNSKINNIEDLDLKLKLFNYTNSSIAVKKYLNVGYCELYDTHICFYVEKLVLNKYKQIFGSANIDRIPMYDSLGNKITDTYDYLESRDSLVKIINPMDVFSFTKGKYRLRVYIKFEAFTETMQLFAKSDWLYFEVVPESIIPIRKK